MIPHVAQVDSAWLSADERLAMNASEWSVVRRCERGCGLENSSQVENKVAE